MISTHPQPYMLTPENFDRCRQVVTRSHAAGSSRATTRRSVAPAGVRVPVGDSRSLPCSWSFWR